VCFFWSITKALLGPAAAAVRLLARLAAWRDQTRLRLSVRRHAKTRDARRAALGLPAVAVRGPLASGDGLFAAPPLRLRPPPPPRRRRRRSGDRSGDAAAAAAEGDDDDDDVAAGPYRALAVLSGSVFGLETPRNLPPAVHLTGPLLYAAAAGAASPLPVGLVRWLEGTDKSQVRFLRLLFTFFEFGRLCNTSVVSHSCSR
jgi:hypothetical protein